MKTEIIIAGHGGQGVLELANNLSFYEMLKGRHVAYTPSYGPESRGGKVKCFVVASDDTIDSPIVEEPDCLIVMNNPSMDFVPLLKSGGILLMNSSLISRDPQRADVKIQKIPATEIADRLKDSDTSGMQDTRVVSNSVMFGAYLRATGEAYDEQTMREVFSHFLVDRKSIYIKLNLLATQKGYDFATGISGAPPVQISTT